MLNEIDLSRADLNLLVLFEAVLEERHVGRAGERLNLTPSAISHGLGRLRRLLADPLFLRTPKGVVPTERALELAWPIAEVLSGVRRVIATAEPFDPRYSTRRFTVGAPDAIAATFLPRLLARLDLIAPGIDVSIRQILPPQEGFPGSNPWQAALDDLETRTIDIALVPSGEIAARFHQRFLYEEVFAVAVRNGHAFGREPTLDHYCGLKHLVVSLTRDDRSFVDEALAGLGRSRRVALAVPNFMMALALVAQTDLVTTLPGSLLARCAADFGLQSIKAPLSLRHFGIHAVTPKAAMMDAGLAWFFELLSDLCVTGESTRET
ncbi:MAG: LysR family transcriptional regulator [Hypericibacter sp.]|jgi:DNA-binding transcriptional LysR family regulator